MKKAKIKYRRTQSIPNQTDDEDEDVAEEWRDWSSLTSPILLSILHLLHSLPDFFSFRSVCRSWRSLSLSSSPSPSLSPLLLLTRSFCSSYSKALFDFNLNLLYTSTLPWSSHTRNTIGYSHGGYIVTTTFSYAPYKILLFNPFTRRQIRLPKTPLFFHRALFSSSPTSPDCSALLFGPNSSLIQFCRPGCERHWRAYDFRPMQFADAIFFQGELYVLTLSGRLGLVRLFDPHPEFVPFFDGEAEGGVGMNNNASNSRRFLAECGGKLLLFCIRFAVGVLEGNVKVEVSGWDFERGGGWVEVGSLGDRAVFFGSTGFAASVVGSVGSGVRANCVYYAWCMRNEWIVYSLEDQVTRVVDARTHPDLVTGWTDDYPVWIFPSIC